MKRIAFLILSLAMSQHVLAREEVLSREAKANISAVVEKYASAISCTEDEGPLVQDIRVLKTPKKDYELPEYIAVWLGSTDCEGMGTTVFQFSVVGLKPNGEFKVYPELSTPAITVDFPQSTFSRIISNTESTIIVEASEHAPNDARCCPSLSFVYTLKIDKNGNWRLASKKPIKNTSRR